MDDGRTTLRNHRTEDRRAVGALGAGTTSSAPRSRRRRTVSALVAAVTLAPAGLIATVTPASAASPCGLGTPVVVGIHRACVYEQPGTALFTVPAGVAEATFALDGAHGGNGAGVGGGSGNFGAVGGRVVTTIGVTPGQVFRITVGGAGGLITGGFNGGGTGADGIDNSSAARGGTGGSGGGGGASDVRIAPYTANDRIIVAAGGGGGGGNGGSAYFKNGGHGGLGGAGGADFLRGRAGTNGLAGNDSNTHKGGQGGGGLAGTGAGDTAAGVGGGGGIAGGAPLSHSHPGVEGGPGGLGVGGDGGRGGAGQHGGDVFDDGGSGGSGGGGGGGYYGGGAGGGGGGGLGGNSAATGGGGGGGGGGSSFSRSSTATYSASRLTGDGQVTVSYTVKDATTTTLTSHPDPSDVGQEVVYTATVSGGAVPTGTVTFEDSGTPIGVPVRLLPGGEAFLVHRYSQAGTHTVTAVYSGDGTHQGSTSAPLTQTVR
ncbi:Ig-like domain-containing protein [Streptacidiphilus anmyonensis]|uniref:Ig-like domain-containing protein n=1 Tax=Streptacidiphilus anmyonensis TaxID=405782 RepID=UPI000693D33C|nr:Ig-like domain-containing protein [Streptacidiphilus anmyonensis]